jgi:hypothetical protein
MREARDAVAAGAGDLATLTNTGAESWGHLARFDARDSLLDERVQAFRERPLDSRRPYLFVDAKFEKVATVATAPRRTDSGVPGAQD